MAFDVESEAQQIANLVPYDTNTLEVPQQVGLLIADALRRAIAATEQRVEEECIKEMCLACAEGDKPVFSPADSYRDDCWWHEYPGVSGPCPEPPSGEYCEASFFHERRRRRETGRGE